MGMDLKGGSKMINYVVRPGDTMAAIASRFNTTAEAIIKANNLSNSDQLFVGQRLQIPDGDGPMGVHKTLPALHPGNRGLLITAVQERLAALGYYKKPVDGIYGRGTADAVTALQRDCGLQTTGSVNRATWQALMAKEACSQGRTCNFTTTQHDNTLLILLTNKRNYKPGEAIRIALVKINTSDASVTLDYTTSQRFDFQLQDPEGKVVYQWSQDRSFSQTAGTVTLVPGQGVTYTVKTAAPQKPSGTYTAVGWNVAKGFNSSRLELPIEISE